MASVKRFSRLHCGKRRWVWSKRLKWVEAQGRRKIANCSAAGFDASRFVVLTSLVIALGCSSLPSTGAKWFKQEAPRFGNTSFRPTKDKSSDLKSKQEPESTVKRDELRVDLVSFQENDSDPDRPGFEFQANEQEDLLLEDGEEASGNGETADDRTKKASGVPDGIDRSKDSVTSESQREDDDRANAASRKPRDSIRSDSENPLTFAELMLSVQVAFPPLLEAAEQRNIALGELTSAWGAFDTVLSGKSIAAPLGFYENYRQTVSVTKPVFHTGGYLFGGYELGRGDIQPWFKERLTNEGGEFTVGGGLPLLKNRRIDERRAQVAMAQISVRLAEPYVRQQLNQFVRDASIAYWDWISAGLTLQIQQELLELAEARAKQIETRVREEDLPRIALIDNSRFITARKVTLNFAEQKLRTTAIKLSLYLRDRDGNLVIPGMDRLPNFPDVVTPQVDRFNTDFELALTARPELNEIDLMIQQQDIQRQLGCNSMLPKLDALALASQDVGGGERDPDDKGPLEFEAGLIAELPLQRRFGRGKVASAVAKIQQLSQKRIFLNNKIQTDMKAALAALEIESVQYGLALKNLQLAREALRIGQVSFDEGDIDLIVLNIYEESVTDAELKVVKSEAEYFAAASEYRLALGIPINQSLEVLNGEVVDIDSVNETDSEPAPESGPILDEGE
jgi:outer membrane protein TolC